MHVTLRTLDDFLAFAGDFARRLLPGDVVALGGAVGSGKTTFAGAVVRALHGEDESSSPSFTFRHRYDGDPPIDHIDFFRVEDPRDLDELGLDDALDGRSIVLIEWWRNAPDRVPLRRYEIDIVGAGEKPRMLSIRSPQ